MIAVFRIVNCAIMYACYQRIRRKPIAVTRRNVQLKAVSLFSGAGGFDLGIEAAGFSTLFASDINAACCETLRINKLNSANLDKPFLQHATIVQSCVKELCAEDILKSIGLHRGEVDLLIGGPPCQSFSVIGPRNGKNDPRGVLIDEYLRLLAEIHPKAFVFENVKGIKSIEGGALYDELLTKMQQPVKGETYTLSVLCLNASDYGVPQNRERIFVIGCRCGHEIESIPKVTGKPSNEGARFASIRTVADALRGLPDTESVYPPNHTGRKHSKRIAERYASLKPGERDPKTRINRLDLLRPAFTIVSGSANSGGKGHIHPTAPREVTPRESARIQTFPDWWKFEGTTVADARRQIGNAVPPLLAAVIANEIRYEFFGLPGIEFEQLVHSLCQTHLLHCI